MGDAVPYGGIRFLEAFASDAGSCIEQAEEGGKGAIGRVFPEEAHGDACGKEQGSFAECFE